MEGLRVDPTDAKDIALYFIKSKEWVVTKPLMVKTVSQAKQLLAYGFTKEDILKGIDFVKSDMSIDVYSLGYFNHALNDVLDKIKIKEYKLQAKAMPALKMEDVDNGSTERNKSKIQSRNVKSNLGKKYNLDCIQEQ